MMRLRCGVSPSPYYSLKGVLTSRHIFQSGLGPHTIHFVLDLPFRAYMQTQSVPLLCRELLSKIIIAWILSRGYCLRNCSVSTEDPGFDERVFVSWSAHEHAAPFGGLAGRGVGTNYREERYSFLAATAVCRNPGLVPAGKPVTALLYVLVTV